MYFNITKYPSILFDITITLNYRQKLQEVKADISTISPTFRKDNNLTAAMGVASGSSSRGKSSGGGGNVTADRAGQIVDILSDAVQVPQAIDVAMDALAADIISIVSVQGQSLESRSALVQFKPLSGLSH